MKMKLDTGTVVMAVVSGLLSGVMAVANVLWSRNQIKTECQEVGYTVGTEIVNTMVAQANELEQSSNEDKETE